MDELRPPMGEDCLLARNKYGAYCVPVASRHRPVSRAILASGVAEPATLELLTRVDPRGDIVHAGAFFGDFIPALARSRAADALVWAFEPSAENHRCACETVRLNELSNVVLTNAALGAGAGAALLATSDEEGTALGGGSRIVECLSGGQAGQEVQVVAIDEIVDPDRQVAAIQLDVERQEHIALSGAMGLIERCRPLIVFEKSPMSGGWIAANLPPLGYRMTGSVHGNAVLICDRHG